MWFILILVTLTSLIVCDNLFRRRRNRLLNTSGIPGPKHTLPFIGDGLLLFGYNTVEIFNLVERLGSEFGKVYRLWLGNKLIVITKDPKFFEVVLSSPDLIKKSYMYEFLSCWLGDGLLLSIGSKWHARRKIFTPTYHFKILEQFVEVFDQQNTVFVERLYKYADGKTEIDIFHKVCLMALDVIAETAMGVKINAQEHPDLPYANAVTTASNIISTRAIKPLQHYDIGFILTALPSYLKLKKSIKIMHDLANKVIKDRKTTLQKNIGSQISINDTINDVGQKKRMTFLDVLLQAEVDGKPLSNKDIRDEVNTFIFGGHDTVTSTMSFCLYLLARHADIQQKVFEEIVEVLGDDKDKPVTMSELHDLKYLDIVIRESLRLYPAAPFMGRYTEQDVNVDGQIIPAHTHIILYASGAFRNPDVFDKPNDFIPERFYSEQQFKKTSFANVPFSAGPRNCIGQKFAMLEMKSTISKVIRHFELLPLGPDVVPALYVVLRSSTGMNLGLKPRKY